MTNWLDAVLDTGITCYICGCKTWHTFYRMSENFKRARCKQCRCIDENEFFLAPLRNKPWLWPTFNA